ncbi:MAG: hypothetical protein ACTTKL_09315 [Treponema sp.]
MKAIFSKRKSFAYSLAAAALLAGALVFASCSDTAHNDGGNPTSKMRDKNGGNGNPDSSGGNSHGGKLGDNSQSGNGGKGAGNGETGGNGSGNGGKTGGGTSKDGDKSKDGGGKGSGNGGDKDSGGGSGSGGDSSAPKALSVEGVWKVTSQKLDDKTYTYPQKNAPGDTIQPYFYWADDEKGYGAINISGLPDEEDNGLYQDASIASWGTPYTLTGATLTFGVMTAEVTVNNGKMVLDARLSRPDGEKHAILTLEKTDSPTPEDFLRAKPQPSSQDEDGE